MKQGMRPKAALTARAYDFLLSFALGLSLLYPHLRHFDALGGFVA
jgi:hypothetical protein